jgi:hypothetical protein
MADAFGFKKVTQRVVTLVIVKNDVIVVDLDGIDNWELPETFVIIVRARVDAREISKIVYDR